MFFSSQPVPAPLHDERFFKKGADQLERRNSLQVEARKTGAGIPQVVPTDQLWNQHSASPHGRSENRRGGVVPVEKGQEFPTAIAADPSPPGILSWKKRSSCREIKTHWRNGPGTGQLFVSIHSSDVPIFGWNEA